MAQSVTKIQTRLMREYYKYFSKYAKGKKPEKKVAWVTAFTPVEILEALDITYYYPESYAAVIAASGKEQELLEKSNQCSLSPDCCSYSCCIEGCLELEEGPRGTPPEPDVLIATNNQCNTLPNWWNILAKRYDVPLIVIDYPGENVNVKDAYTYVTEQHKNLIEQMEQLSGNKLDESVLAEFIKNSERSVYEWNRVASYLTEKQMKPTELFDGITYLITSRCRPETAELYELMAEELENREKADAKEIPIFWLGYPLWYHEERYFSKLLDGFRVSGSNYITWWSLDYHGKDIFEKLFNAYNYTFLNLSQKTRNIRLSDLIQKSDAVCAITLHNKSCKCDFVSAKNIKLPQVEVEIDMIDRTFADIEKAQKQMELLKETVCTELE